MNLQRGLPEIRGLLKLLPAEKVNLRDALEGQNAPSEPRYARGAFYPAV
jgi:hypothetical protein